MRSFLSVGSFSALSEMPLVSCSLASDSDHDVRPLGRRVNVRRAPDTIE